MPPKEKIERESLQASIKTLILQEVRVMQLEQLQTPPFMIQEMIHSIQETKRQVISLLRLIPSKERDTLIKRAVRQSVNEEIDQAIQARQNRCLRCVHMRYFDETGSPHENIPFGIDLARMIGCVVTPLSSKIQCRQFIESPMAPSVEEYVNAVAFFYEVKEMFDQFDRIWEDYFLNR